MNTETGEIGSYKALMDAEARRLLNQGANMADALRIAEGKIKPVDLVNLSSETRNQLQQSGRAFITRNSPCPCGSGKRFKRCCKVGK